MSVHPGFVAKGHRDNFFSSNFVFPAVSFIPILHIHSFIYSFIRLKRAAH